MKCQSVHLWSDTKCIRPNGHDGKCWGRAIRNRQDGTITRAEWYSKDGKYSSHAGYDTRYPPNSAKGTP